MKTPEEYKILLWEKYLQSKNKEIYDRYLHSLAVSHKALELIATFSLRVDPYKAEVAGILHDYAKFETIDKYREIVSEYELDPKYLRFSPKVLHALLGPYIVNKELGISDGEILNAIKNHTTGSLDMDLLSEVIFLADFTDETRIDEYFKEAKAMSKINFKQAIALKIKKKIDEHPNLVDEATFEMYKKYKEE